MVFNFQWANTRREALKGRSGTLAETALKGAGGKRWLIPVLARLGATQFRRLVEPFAADFQSATDLRPEEPAERCQSHLLKFLQSDQRD